MPKILLSFQLPLAARYMLFSALGFALMAVCVKWVAAYGIPVLEIVAARALVSLVISYIDVKRKGLSIWGYNKPWLIARGAVGTLALVCVYYAITTLPLAEATILQYLHPVFTALLAFIFLKEKLQTSTQICIVLSSLGLLLIVQPEFLDSILNITNSDYVSNLPALSIIAALLGAFGSAAAYVIVKKLSASEDSSVIIFYFPLIALPLSLLLLGESFVMPSLNVWVLLIFVGIFTQVGQVGLTKAMQTESAGKATAYSYMQVLFSIVLGWWWFAEIPSTLTLLGGSFIIAGALVNILFKR